MATKDTARPTRRGFLTRVHTLWPYALVVAIVLVSCQTLPSPLVSRTDAKAPRDLNTGVLIGAEELVLGPEDAPTAVLLVHGFIGAMDNFWSCRNGSSPKGTGCGRFACRATAHPPPPARDMVDTTGGDLLEALVREAGVLEKKHDRVVLVGHSMGAR